jgi:restriction endonuclease Mrr
MLDLNALDLGEIAHALSDQTAYEHCWLIHSETGEIVYWSADTGIDGHTKIDLDDLDPELISIRPLPSWIWYQDLEDFAEGISDDHAGRSLARALQDRSPFRRFKNKLHQYPNLLPVWHAFSEARALRRAVQWLAEEELINQEAADRYQIGHPEPDLP